MASFKITKKTKFGQGRRGEIRTSHGLLRTPVFMPDATRGYVKIVASEEVRVTGIKALVVNTYHLWLQPGLEIIKRAGGLHKFMDWSGPLLSDSGGFQVFSLIHRSRQMGKVFDDKVVFKSPIDGTSRELTPEKSIQIQFDLGVDMMVCLDDCPPNSYTRVEIEKAVERTIAWADRAKREYVRQLKKRKIKSSRRPLLFSVVQGGADIALRRRCAAALVDIGFDGYGFGAMPVDASGKFLDEVVAATAAALPEDSLRFALGIGNPEDIVKCFHYGWDMFDCVIPTREGRHGRIFLPGKKIKFKIQKSKFKIIDFYKTINITNSKFKKDFSPINGNSKIPELRKYSKAYLNHLFKMKEALGQKLASLNNLEFYAKIINKLQ